MIFFLQWACFVDYQRLLMMHILVTKKICLTAFVIVAKAQVVSGTCALLRWVMIVVEGGSRAAAWRGVDDLCFHTREFSPSPPPTPTPSPPPSPPSPSPNLQAEAGPQAFWEFESSQRTLWDSPSSHSSLRALIEGGSESIHQTMVLRCCSCSKPVVF